MKLVNAVALDYSRVRLEYDDGSWHLVTWKVWLLDEGYTLFMPYWEGTPPPRMTISGDGYHYENVLGTDDPVVVGAVRRTFAMNDRRPTGMEHDTPVPTPEEAIAERGMDYPELADKVEAIIKGGSGG